MATSFQPATPADIDVLLGMMRELYTLEHIPFDLEVARTALAALLQEPIYGCVWLITDDREPVGYVVVTFDYSLEYGGRDAFIDELFVREGHRRRGIGTQAVQMAEAACRERGIRALHLEVERSNLAAQAAYRRAGFVDHDRDLMTRRLDRDPVADSPPPPWRRTVAGRVLHDNTPGRCCTTTRRIGSVRRLGIRVAEGVPSAAICAVTAAVPRCMHPACPAARSDCR